MQPFINLKNGERTDLQKWSERDDDIVETKTDKGGAVVITDLKDYIRVAESQLKNKDSYNKTKTLSN